MERYAINLPLSRKVQLYVRRFTNRVFGRKASPFIWPSWRGGRPEWHLVDYQAYAQEGYNVNSLVYSALMYKAKAVIASPLRAYKGDPLHPEVLPADAPLSQLIARPNPYQSGAEFMQLAVVYLNLDGNCFIHLDRPLRSQPPVAMRLLRPDRVFIVPDTQNGIKGFLYVPEGKTERSGVPLLPQDVIHVKLPNPFDPLEGWGYGISPISPAARSADVDNIVTRYLKLFFEKGTMMSNVLKFDDPLDTDTVAEVKSRWAQQYGGWENWAEVGVIDRGGEVQRLGLTFEEMGFEAIDERNESRILGPFGVPPILLGTRTGLMRSTYSNYEEARRAFWEDTFVAELQLFETELDYYLTGSSPEFVRFDTSQVPALRKDIYQQITGAHTLWTMGMPADDAFSVVGLDVKPIPGGKQGYLPVGVIPVGSSPAPALPAGGRQQPPPGNKTPPEGDDSGKPDATDEEDERKAVVRPFRPRGYPTRPSIGSGME